MCLCVCVVVVVDSLLILITEGKGGIAPLKRRLQRRKMKTKILLEMEWKHAPEQRRKRKTIWMKFNEPEKLKLQWTTWSEKLNKEVSAGRDVPSGIETQIEQTTRSGIERNTLKKARTAQIRARSDHRHSVIRTSKKAGTYLEIYSESKENRDVRGWRV